jgi:hypothetical protein
VLWGGLAGRLKTDEYIKGAGNYFYVAILPENIKSASFQKYIKTLALMPETNTRSCWWGDIESFFNNIKAQRVMDVFDFNKYID